MSLLKKTGSQRNRDRLPVSDCQQIAWLLKGRMNWKMTLDFIENRTNREVVQKLRDQLQAGEQINDCLLTLMPQCLVADYEVLSQLMAVHQALLMSCELNEQRRKVREQTLKVILYPAAMLAVSLAGLGLFNHFCFPMMISLAESFSQNISGYQNIHLLIRIFLILVAAGIVLIMTGLWFARIRFYRLSAYLVLIQKGKGEWIRRIRSLDFARYFLCCMREGCATRSTLTLMQKIRNKPFLKLLSWHVEQGLLRGESFETALKDEVIDPSLMRVMRCITLSQEPEALLQSYILIRQKQIEEKIKNGAVMIQCSAYMIIGLMVILVYQILLLPLSMISGI